MGRNGANQISDAALPRDRARLSRPRAQRAFLRSGRLRNAEHERRRAQPVGTTHPERCRAAVLSGFGPDNSTSDGGRREELAIALLATDAASITEYQRRIRRAVIEAGNDQGALAACIRCDTNIPKLSAVTPIRVPVLFVKGVKDYVAGDPNGLSGYFRESQVLVIDNNGHASVVADPRFHTAVADFLAAAPA